MLLQEFSQEMAKRGCTEIEPGAKIFCGVFENYPFSVQFLKGSAGGSTKFTVHWLLNSKVTGKLFKAVRRDTKGQLKITRTVCIPNQGNASIVLKGPDGKKVSNGRPAATFLANFFITVKKNQNLGQSFDNLIHSMTHNAYQLGHVPPQSCPVCNGPGNDGYSFLNGMYQPAHMSCVKAYVDQEHEAVAKNELSGSIALGIIGAILGAALGSVPSILLLVFTEYISAWLLALMPLGAYYGYKKLGGRMNSSALITTIVVSVLFVPVLFYLMQAFWFYKDEGIFINPATFMEIARLYPEDVIPGFLQTLLFSGIGLLFVSRVISRNNTHQVAGANHAIGTLRPSAVAPAAAPVQVAVPPASEQTPL